MYWEKKSQPINSYNSHPYSPEFNFFDVLKIFFPDEKVKVNVQNNFSPTNTNDIKNSNVQNTITTNYVQDIQDVTINIKNYFLDKTIYCKKYLENGIKDFYLKNKKYIIPSAIISSYLSTCLILKIGNKYIESYNLWSNWRPLTNNNLDFADAKELKQFDHKELTKLLLTEIQSRYTSYKDPLDLLLPLSAFIKNLEKEKNKLTFYLNFYTFLETTKLIKIFPINTENFLKIKSKLDKLLFIRNTFFTWLYMYKIEIS